MPDYNAIIDYLSVVSKLAGKRDETLEYLLSMAILHCRETNTSAPRLVKASA